MSDLPLKAIRVLDLTRILAGPLASQMLADLGAEVIKIERPGTGDESRTFGPPYLSDESGKATRENAFYLSANRGKKSVTVDIGSAEGQRIIRELASRSDVLIENFKVGDLARYGLDYDSIRAINPRLVYCSVTGFGQTGPYRKRPGYDAVFQGMGGLMSVTGYPDDQPGGGPVKVGPSIVDVLTGLNAVIGIFAALYHRDVAGGAGQRIDISLLDSVVASLSHYAQIYLVSGIVPPRRGTAGNGGIPSQMFTCRDGQIMLTAGNDAQYRRLCDAIGRPDLATDPRFATNNARVENRVAITAELDAIFARNTVDHWLQRLEAAEVPAGPVNDLAQVFADPQVRERAMQVSAPHPLNGDLTLVGSPLKFSETPITSYGAPPMLGADTDDVLCEILGMRAQDVAALRQQAVI